MGGKISVASSKSEIDYLNRVKKHPNQVIMAHKDSIQEGFEYFESEEFTKKHLKSRSPIRHKLLSVGIKNLPRMIKIFAKYMSPMFSGKNKCFTDLNEYLNELDTEGNLLNRKHTLLDTYPNKKLWTELQDYAWDKWQVNIGFTELPSELIFKGKAVLFKYTIVCIQEMLKDKIDLAPDFTAGEEVQRVYSSLGIAANDIADWLRQNFNIRCQSNHPLGGLVNTTPLAAKAGMGWQGHNGLLITQQYGPRQRITPIFIEDKIFEFTDNKDHIWIEDFCRNCRRCEKSCPTQAIYSEKQPTIQDIPGINQTRTCIDRLKCYEYFSKTLGCSICLRVCPFSKGEEAYQKLKNNLENKLRKSM